MDSRPAGTAYEQVGHVERMLFEAVGSPRFLPHLVLHELEAWVFAAGNELASLRGDNDLASRLKRDCDLAGGPELVNDGPDTAPSKRLAKYCRGYAKKIDGPLSLEDLRALHVSDGQERLE